jgi:rSAM/selenodomain-associated transferase 1
MNLVVIAKAPLPGASKTRLSPPCTPMQAAALAEAMLADTLAAAARTEAGRRVLALEGPPGSWLPAGFEVVSQREGELDERLATVAEQVGGPVLIVGMDTPQVTPGLLERAMAALRAPGVDAVLGEAMDGGYWAIGLRTPDRMALLGVPMSVPDTCTAQRERLRALGLAVADLPELRDVDTFEDALAVAEAAPGSHFAAVVRSIAMSAAPARIDVTESSSEDPL